MKTAIELLEKELLRINQPKDDDDDDIYGAVINLRQNVELKLAIKILKNAVELSGDLGNITWD